MGIKIALEWACLRVNKKNHHGVITEMVLHLSIVLLTSTKSSRFFPHRENRMLILIQTNNNLSKRIGIVGYKGGWLADASSENNRIFVLNFDSDKGQDQMIVFKDRISVTLLRDGVWKEQYKVATLNDLWPQSPGTEIIAETDMRTITTPGHYYCANNSTAASLKNCPLSDAFTLVVYRSAGGAGDNVYYVAQEYTSYMCNRRVIQTYNKDSKNWTIHEIQFKP